MSIKNVFLREIKESKENIDLLYHKVLSEPMGEEKVIKLACLADFFGLYGSGSIDLQNIYAINNSARETLNKMRSDPKITKALAKLIISELSVIIGRGNYSI